jgi:hypothetical protein
LNPMYRRRPSVRLIGTYGLLKRRKGWMFTPNAQSSTLGFKFTQWSIFFLSMRVCKWKQGSFSPRFKTSCPGEWYWQIDTTLKCTRIQTP